MDMDQIAVLRKELTEIQALREEVAELRAEVRIQFSNQKCHFI